MKQTLFPKITAVFSRTTMLSVKVNTLICFHSMVKTLDKFTLTEKLVPLLAKIKTKEPAVMVATLAVHEALGNKCEIEASSSPLLSPRIWADGMDSRDSHPPAIVGYVNGTPPQRRSIR